MKSLKFKLLLAVLAVAFTGTLTAEQPYRMVDAARKQSPQLSIDGKTTVDLYRFVELSIKNAPTDAAVIWDVYPEDAADIRELNGGLMFVAPAGTYRVKARLIQGKQVTTLRTTVTIGVPAPPVDPPKPAPVDPPKPAPAPVSMPVSVIIIEESSAAAIGRGRLLGNQQLVNWLQQKGIKVSVVDKDVRDENGNVPASLLTFIRGTTDYPTMYTLDAKGNIVDKRALPGTVDGFREALAGIVGN